MIHSAVTTGLPECINTRTKPKKGHTAKLEALRWELRGNREPNEHPPLDGKVALLIIVRGDKRADADARTKAILDGCEHVLYENDKQVGPHTVLPMPGAPGVDVQCFAWPEERKAWLAAQEAATCDGSENGWPEGCGGPA